MQLLHEALLVLKEYVKSPRSDYYLPPNLTVEEMVQMIESVLRKASSIYSHKEREDGGKFSLPFKLDKNEFQLPSTFNGSSIKVRIINEKTNFKFVRKLR